MRSVLNYMRRLVLQQGLEFQSRLMSIMAIMLERHGLSLLFPALVLEHGMVTMAAKDTAGMHHIALTVAAFPILVVVGVTNHLAIRGLADDHEAVPH